MRRIDWLARMDAAVDAALSADCSEACLESWHRAGIYSVRARAAEVSGNECGEG